MKILAIAAAGLAVAFAAAPAFAEDAAPKEEAPKDGFSLSGYVAVDIIGATNGGFAHHARELDKSAIVGEFRYSGFHGVLDVMNTSGAQPNSDVGSLQGVDNNEAPSRRLRLFEAWVEHDLFTDKLSAKAGLIDLNGDGEYMVTGASGIFLGPQFGVLPELAVAGPGGPSAYPISGLTAQLQWSPADNYYVRAAISNAHLGTFGDQGGINTNFDLGVFDVAEAGYEKDDAKLAFGYWRFSRKQDDLFDTIAGVPVQRAASGGYVLGQMHVFGDDKANKATAFVRASFSDGDTTPLRGGWAVGVTIENLGGKEGRSLAFAVDQARLGGKYRAASAAAGAPLDAAETQFEATFAQDIGWGISLQPDLQYIVRPGGDPTIKNALVAALRITKSFGGK